MLPILRNRDKGGQRLASSYRSTEVSRLTSQAGSISICLRRPGHQPQLITVAKNRRSTDENICLAEGQMEAMRLKLENGQAAVEMDYARLEARIVALFTEKDATIDPYSKSMHELYEHWNATKTFPELSIEARRRVITAFKMHGKEQAYVILKFLRLGQARSWIKHINFCAAYGMRGLHGVGLFDGNRVAPNKVQG